MPRQPLAEFTNLAAVHLKVDTKFAAITELRGEHIQCRSGCHSCCLPNLTVASIEAAQIRQYFVQNPSALAAAVEVAHTDPHAGLRCHFLDAAGACIVYPVRPALCRAHGVPAWVQADAQSEPQVDVCPLNFQGVDLTTLPDDRIDVDTLNTLVFMVGELWQRDSSRRRVGLSLKALRISRRGAL
ncbi:MAG: YkgJ family cysteine cluster protein [Myxococcales bacterium]|nr:YkgJ family cysteine cluster protein [Myxococcales bacterium]